MATVSGAFRRAWRSAKYVGGSRPKQRVYIRNGHFKHGYKPWTGHDVHAAMPGRSETEPWQATWHPDEDWREVPNVGSVDFDQDFTNNGITNCTIKVDNVIYEEDTGLGGPFHRILRGFLAPTRGFAAKTRPKPTVAQNEWFRYLDRCNQIRVDQGYGSEIVETFTGLTDVIDLRSKPDEITITARDFGQTLTDQLNLGRARDKALGGSPTVFAPLKEWDRPFSPKHKNEAAVLKGHAQHNDCSSYHKAHPPTFVTHRHFTDSEDFWQSAYKPGPSIGSHGSLNTEWVQIHLPAGRYRSFYIDPAYGGMECWLSIYARKKNIKTDTKTCKVDGERIPDGWIDLGRGTVPGDTDGGEPWIRHWGRLGLQDREYDFHGHEIELGDDSLLRVSFRNLREIRHRGQPRWVAGVRSLFGVRQLKHPHKRPKHSKQGHQDDVIYVKDVSDMVKVALRWAGFKEWNIESTGVTLPTRLTFHNGDTLMDIIGKARELTNYAFFMGDPSGNTGEYSIGVPTFRQARIVTTQTRVEEVRGRDLLTGIQAKWDRAPLRDPIYVRGHAAKKGWRKGGKGRGYGEDHTQRVQALYRPPWHDSERTGGLLRHIVKRYEHLTSERQCKVAARMIALNCALASATAIIEIPANPGIELDSYVGVIDLGTGTNTRIYVSNRSSRFTAGEKASWTMSLGGALVDAPDVRATVEDLWEELRKKEPREAKGGRHRRRPRTPQGDTYGQPEPHRGRSHPGQHRDSHQWHVT